MPRTCLSCDTALTGRQRKLCGPTCGSRLRVRAFRSRKRRPKYVATAPAASLMLDAEIAQLLGSDQNRFGLMGFRIA
jgi:hypothetical protein